LRLFDYECKKCGQVTEELLCTGEDRKFSVCPACGSMTRRIISISQTTPIDADWIAGVREVVDKSGKKPWCQEFLKHPTRANLNAWMKGEGLRHLDPGESGIPKIDRGARREQVKRHMLESNRKREAISI